ncbi:MAG: FecR domain-containing protein [Pseudomonadota bacterium]
MSEKPNEKQMARLLIGLTEGRLSDAQLQELRDLVQEDAACRHAYIDHMTMHAMLEFRHGRIEAQAESGESESRLIESLEIQTYLAEGDDEIFPEPFSLENLEKEIKPGIGAKQAFSLLGYEASKAVRKHAAVLSGVAAIVLLAVILLFVFRGMMDEPVVSELVVDEPPAPVVERGIVATLTAERDSQWVQGALAPGSPLRAGDRLTLTQGFAEITTNRGAIAILEAPATIELTENDNSIHLHAGKIIGICETESSKGFLVHTPQMDVIDLGTRFGINVMKLSSSVHVFDGEVTAVMAGKSRASTDPIHLSTGQAIAITPDSSDPRFFSSDVSQFTAVTSASKTIAITGDGLAKNQPDTSWQIIAINGKPIEQPITPLVSAHQDHLENVLADQPEAQWLTYNDSAGPRDRNLVTYTFRTEIHVPASTQLQTMTLNADCIVDNGLAGIRINGENIEFASIPYDSLSFRSYAMAAKAGVLRHGDNSIELDVVNGRGTPLGLLVAFDLRYSIFDITNLQDPR